MKHLARKMLRTVCADVLGVAAQVTDSNGRIILFIDEIHTVVGAGASEGSMDAGAAFEPCFSDSPARNTRQCPRSMAVETLRQGRATRVLRSKFACFSVQLQVTVARHVRTA